MRMFLRAYLVHIVTKWVEVEMMMVAAGEVPV